MIAIDSTRNRGRLVGIVRIVVGLLWLANLEWKRPPDFGRDLSNGLYKYVDSAVRNPVFAPYSWFVEHVVVKQYTLFGWVTLLVEAGLAVCLLLGWHTRIAALVGAGMAVNIMLSVLYYDKQYEWPWSYYLMIAIHLALFATLAGDHLGLDGLRAAGAEASRRAIVVLGAVGAIVGVVALIVASDRSFTAHQGALVGWARGELKLLWFNPFSALLTVVLGALAVAGAWRRLHVLVLAAAAGFALMALQVLAQWRYRKGDWTGGVLGGTGATMAFWAMLAVGLAVSARRARSVTNASTAVT